MTVEEVRSNVDELLRLVRGSARRSGARRVRELLDETHEGLITIMVREAHAAACLSRARRHLDAGCTRAAITALRVAESDLDGGGR